MVGRDLTKICGVGDVVFNHADSKLYAISNIQNNIFTCTKLDANALVSTPELSIAAPAKLDVVDDNQSDDLMDFDITKTSFTKVLN